MAATTLVPTAAVTIETAVQALEKDLARHMTTDRPSLNPAAALHADAA